jgi:hypothetical protein
MNRNAVTPTIGLTWDEPTYIVAVEAYPEWYAQLLAQPSYALSAEGVARYGSTSHEHPPLSKVWSGLASVKIVAEMLEAEVDEFWRGDEVLRQSVLPAFANAGLMQLSQNLSLATRNCLIGIKLKIVIIIFTSFESND